METPERYGKVETLQSKIAADNMYKCIVSTLTSQCNFYTPFLCNKCRNQNCIIEKAGFDEFYLDLTNLVRRKLAEDNSIRVQYIEQMLMERKRNLKIFLYNKQINGHNYDTEGLETIVNAMYNDQQLRAFVVGLEIVDKILDDLKTETGFVLSAGFGTNKLMAKFACFLSKPNGVALLPSRSLKQVENQIPFQKITGLGGVAGEEIKRRWGFIESIRDFRKAYTRLKLWKNLNENYRGEMYDKCKGIDPTYVTPLNLLPKITCGKKLNTCMSSHCTGLSCQS